MKTTLYTVSIFWVFNKEELRSFTRRYLSRQYFYILISLNMKKL